MGGCAAFHFNNRRECFLKGLPQQIIPSDSKFGTRLCIKNDICEKGYLYMPGDVPGSGSNKYLTTGGIDSAEKCAEFCTKEDGCGSYEFSPSELKCNINTENEPTSRRIYKDYQFCSKEKTGKHASFIRYLPTDVRKAMEAAAKKAKGAKASSDTGPTTTAAAAKEENKAKETADDAAEAWLRGRASINGAPPGAAGGFAHAGDGVKDDLERVLFSGVFTGMFGLPGR